MIATRLSEISSHLDGRLIGEDQIISSLFTDSRQQNKKGLFLALKGPHFDAHRFVTDVAESGADAVLVDHQCNTNKPQVIVKNTRMALAEIARLNRIKSSAKYIAITGSCGKTTVKEMVASILQLSGKTFATQGNFNNDIGVPLTLLEFDESIEFGVVELGANHAGEVAYTADITRPDVALVNNVSAAHLEGFGSLQGVATAKREIYTSLSEQGTAVINEDDDFSDYFEQIIKSKILTYSVNKNADVMAKNIQLNENQLPTFDLHFENEKVEVNLSVVGLHNIANALAAASCAIAVGISLKQIAKGLQVTPLVSGRLIVKQLISGCRVIDDSYNANVASMKAAIDLLKNYPAPTILVLGDMAELGEHGRQCHEEIGQYAKESNIEKLFSCGVLTQFSQAAFNDQTNITNRHFNQQHELIKILTKEAKSGTTILIKGSRSAHMENVVKALIESSNKINSENDLASQQGKN